MKDEQQYNEFIKKQVKNSEDLHFSDIEQNKENVWDRIETRMEKKKVIPLWFYAAVASIILLIGLGSIFNQKLTNKNIEIASLKDELEVKDSRLAKIDETKYKVMKLIDTVKIVNEKVVYLPVKSYEKVVICDTVTNVVKVIDTVYVHRKEEAKFVVNDIEEDNNQQITVNSNRVKKKKNRRFVFLFGKPKEETNRSDNARLITLRTK